MKGKGIYPKFSGFRKVLGVKPQHLEDKSGDPPILEIIEKKIQVPQIMEKETLAFNKKKDLQLLKLWRLRPLVHMRID